MLTAATLGMVGYGLYSIGAGIVDLIMTARLEWWANLWSILAGAVLVLAAALVRVSMPGGLALAIGGLLALQSIGLHNTGHTLTVFGYLPEFLRAALSATLVTLAYLGWQPLPQDPRSPDQRQNP